MLRPKPVTGKGWVGLPCGLDSGESSSEADVDQRSVNKVGTQGRSEANPASAEPARGAEAPQIRILPLGQLPGVDLCLFSVPGTQIRRGEAPVCNKMRTRWLYCELAYLEDTQLTSLDLGKKSH